MRKFGISEFSMLQLSRGRGMRLLIFSFPAKAGKVATLTRAREHVRRGGLRRAAKETTRYVGLYGVIFSGLSETSGRVTITPYKSFTAVFFCAMLFRLKS